MKAFVATSLTQGQRANDYNHCRDGELVMLPLLLCTSETADGECGCHRAFAGVESGVATTTAVVAEIDLTEAEWRAAVADRCVKDSYFRSVADVPSDLMLWQTEFLRAAAPLAVGVVVEYRDDVLAIRASNLRQSG